MKRVFSAIFVLTVLMAGIRAQGPAPISNDDWKRWLDRVDPLMMQAERKEAKTTAPSERVKFQEDFWHARNSDPSNPENPVRAQFEIRMRTAEKRFLINGKKWTDCGRTFLVLGKPDWEKNTRIAQHFGAEPLRGAPDPLRAFQDQEQVATEEWTYRNHPKLPPAPEGYTFRFNPACESVASRTADALLDQVAASYVVKPR
jgi:GWxTD domain-containing protein